MLITLKRLTLIFLINLALLGLQSGFFDCLAQGEKAVLSNREQEAASPRTENQGPENPSPAVPEMETQSLAPTEKRELLVQEIEVRGNRVISTGTIVSKMRTRKGELLQQEVIKEDLKRLYGTGFFKDIQTEIVEVPDGYKVIVIVDEKPIAQQIIIEGNTKFGSPDLRKELKIVEGQVLSEFELNSGVEAIRKKYHDKGFKFVDIKTEMDVNEETKEAVIYILINEGAVYKIRTITLNGVQSFKLRKIRKLFRTKKKGFLRSGAFREDRFRDDLERVRAFYQEHGFLDAKVEPNFSYDHENKRVDITININEGSPYVTGKVDIEGNVLFPESEIWQELEMLPGLTYSQNLLSEDVDRIRKFYYERGYINAEVTPDTQFNSATGKVDVSYSIAEGDLFFIDQVKIRGNTKTKDLVIRRQLSVFPGERFDGKKVDRSKQKLEDLDYFEEVDITTEEGSAPNRKNLVVHVKEKRTGELSFGAGISSVEQFLGFAEIAQRNFDFKNFPTFTGGGQSLSLAGRLGSKRQTVDLEFIEPYIFNKPYSFAVNVFSRNNLRNNVDFEEERLGFAVDVGKRFWEVMKTGVGYTLENVKLDEIDVDAAKEVTASGTDNLLSRIRWFISRDTRDSTRKPTYGSVASFSAELVGTFLGGDQDLTKYQAGFTKYFTFLGRHHFEWANRIGVASSFGDSDQVPVFERFYAGGLGSVRGFDARRVGPIKSGDAVGGSTLVLSSLEYTFPIIENFKGAFFIDAGHVNESTFDMDFGEIAISIGPGVKINTPIGPVAFYYGFPVANEDEKNKNGKFEFSLSRGF